MRRIIFIIAALMALNTLQAQQLQFNKDRQFKIVQFTDIHWKANDPNSEIAKACMDSVLDAEKPDLVVYTGDLVYSRPAKIGLDRAFEPVISRHLPFAYVFGNHDDEQDMTRKEIYEYVKVKEGCLMSTTPGITGVSNYTLTIKDPETKKDSFILYCFDSNSYSSAKQTKGYDWIHADQVEWYRKISASFTKQNGNKPMPAMAFFHIPFPEYADASSTDGNELIGTRKETVCCPKVNSGLFQSLLECGDVMATFVGHDHINDYVTYWKGIALGYGRFSGGNTVYNEITNGNGARVIVLTEGKRSFETWIRLRNKTIINHINFPDDFLHP